MLYFCSIVFQLFLRLYKWHIYYIGINNHNPTEGIPTLTQWWGLCGQMILRSMPDRSKVMTQTKRDTLFLQVGGWVWGWPHPIKNIFFEMSLTFLGKSSPDGKTSPFSKRRVPPVFPKMGSLWKHSKWVSVFGYGQFLDEGFNSRFFFDCHNNLYYHITLGNLFLTIWDNVVVSSSRV